MASEEFVPRRRSSIDRHLGRRLRLVRELSNLTQRDLAGRMNISVDQLARYEIGSERIPAQQLFDAANVLAVPGPWFFEDLASSRVDDLSGGTEHEAQIYELKGLIRTASSRDHLSDLRENAQNRLHEIYNLVNR